MNNNGKKYRSSGITTACYVIAALMFGYACYQIWSTVQTINEYYASYGMSAQPVEYITYTLQAALQPLVYAIGIFMLGHILDAVRRNNKSNYLSDEELLDAADAKRKAREAKKLAKGEAAAAKAGNVTTAESSVEADFARSLDEELKADEKKAEARGEGRPENRKPRSNNYNRSNQNRQGSKPNPNRNRSEGGSKNNNGNGGSGSKNGNGGQRKSSNSSNSKKPAADKPKPEDAAKAKAGDGFEVVINEKENQ